MENKNNKLSQSDFFQICSLKLEIAKIWLKYSANDIELSDDKGSLSDILWSASQSLQIILDDLRDDLKP